MARLRATLGVRLLEDQVLDALRALFGDIAHEAAVSLARRAEWIALEGGETLCAQGEPGDRLFVLLIGRLQAVWRPPEGAERVVAEIGRGELVGEMAFFSGEPRSAALVAMRDCVCLGWTHTVFEEIAAAHPQVMTHIVRLLIGRLQPGRRSERPRASNVAIVPLHAAGARHRLGPRLGAALGALGPTVYLDAARVDDLLGAPGVAQAPPDHDAGASLAAWLDEQEGRHRFVVYVADPADSEWTRRCVRQADRVLLVADASAPADEPALAAGLAVVRERPGTRRTLVLTHPATTRLPAGTARWRAAAGVDDHVHVRAGVERDLARLARRVAGRAVGVVLGGGGARGFAHLGVLRALDEAGIPVDIVGGTSMGAFIAGQYAMGLSHEEMLANFRRVWMELRPQYEVRLPIVSFVGNRKAIECGRLLYGEADVEDCWTDFFCVSSDLTRAAMRVHHAGSLRMATLASASLPVFAPPIAEHGSLLVDGGLVNNLPTDVARELGAGRVIACKVSVDNDDTFTADRVPTSWEVLGRRFRRGPVTRPFPTLFEVLGRATMLGAIRLESAAMAGADLGLEPPVAGFRLLDFSAVDAVARVGYEYARERLAAEDLDAWRV